MIEPTRQYTAATLLSKGQWIFGAMLLIATVTVGAMYGPLALLKIFYLVIVAFYATVTAFRLLAWYVATHAAPALTAISGDEATLPHYGILVPIKGEAGVVKRLVRALQRLRYPSNKLQILLLLEEDDLTTISAVQAAKMQPPFEVLIVPDIPELPQTKPRALNYGFEHLDPNVSFVTVYDAEDTPHPNQLRQAIATFHATAARRPDLGCLQARLSFWNPRRSLVSTMYWAEYTVLFRWLLPGLARLRLIPPLGGTSNHFRRQALEAVAATNPVWGTVEHSTTMVTLRGPWDPWNVTEDADLAARLARAGWSIDMVDSVTYEEAPASVGRAIRQRSRWVKGFCLTALVHSRRPRQVVRDIGTLRFAAFHLIIGGTPLTFVFTPIVWGTTLLYMVARLDHLVPISTFIETLFPAPVYYSSMVVAVGGNTLLLFQHLLAPTASQEATEAIVVDHNLAAAQATDEYGLTLRLLLLPLWWTLTPISAVRAFVELLVPSWRWHWAKTEHGHDDERETELVGEGVA